MRSAAHHAAFVQHDDPIGVADGAQPVRDHDAGAAFHQLVQGFLHESFAGGVEAAGGFVQDQDRGILQHGTRDRDPLALAAAQLHAALTNYRIVSFRER